MTACELAARPASRRTRLVVVEQGAPELCAHLRPDDGDETVVVTQVRGECAVEFAFRVMGRLAALEASQRLVEEAMMLLGPALDPSSLSARALAAKALVRHLAAVPTAELVLRARRRDEKHGSNAFGLVDLISVEPSARRVSLRVCYDDPSGEPAPASGIHPKPSARRAGFKVSYTG